VNAQILIDAVVRQTVILIAQLSTADGVRSPLAHIADDVFRGLVRELESQGLGKKVIADMFGLALRSYQQKVQRLGESATTRGVSLWGAIHAFFSEVESITRAELLEHFKDDEEQKVRSILNDLVETGLVCRSGRGDETRYRAATAEELQELGAAATVDSEERNAALAWVQVYRNGPIRVDELGRLVPVLAEALQAAIDRLVSDERIQIEVRPDGPYCVTKRCLIPLGQAAGWEAAIMDHHRAVLAALAAKVASGRHNSGAADEVGGTTLSFDLWPGHPEEAEVRRLLAAVRQQILPLWDRVAAYNREHRPDTTYKVTFYCGQYLVEEDETT
jgi:hypothetical protein